MRVVIHDFAGHPFQIQLSRELSRRGHHVLHLYFEDVLCPKGAVQKTAADPHSFCCQPITLGRPFPKYSFMRRYIRQREYAKVAGRTIADFHPDVVVSGNTPSDVQKDLLVFCRSRRIPFVHWVQDLFPLAVQHALGRKLGALGALLALPVVKQEQYVFRNAAAVVLVAPEFTALATRHFPTSTALSVIENWAPLDELTPTDKVNRWSEEHGLSSGRLFLYAGTLGLKHNPNLLLRLATMLCPDDDARLVVITEGVGREQLQIAASNQHVPYLRLMNFQPYQDLPLVFSSADVLIAVIGSDAAAYSVPSKVLSYFCAGKAVLLAAPRDNLAAKLVGRAKAGIVVEPDDVDSFLQAARALLDQPGLAAEYGRNARTYALSTFDIAKIGDRFMSVLDHACSSGRFHREKTVA